MTKPLFPVALSIKDAAAATRLPVRLIRRAIYQDATLEAYMVKDRVRILVVDFVEWLRSMPRATLLRAKKRQGQTS